MPRFIDGSRTLKSTSNFPYVAERRGVIFIERSLKQGLQFARHKNNTEALRAQVRRTITAFLNTQDHDLFDWFEDVAGTASGLILTDPMYKRNGDIVQQDQDGTTLRRWSLFQAWPVKFVAGDWDNESDENVIETVTRHQLRRIRRAARRYGVEITLIVDVIHVLEYLWKAGHVFHRDGTPEAEQTDQTVDCSVDHESR